MPCEAAGGGLSGAGRACGWPARALAGSLDGRLPRTSMRPSKYWLMYLPRETPRALMLDRTPARWRGACKAWLPRWMHASAGGDPLTQRNA